MALNESECAEAYDWLVAQLTRAGLQMLVHEADALVRAGTTREEESERGATVTIRAPLSSREKLVAALRLFLAAASVPLMLESVSETVEPPARSFRWSPDYVGGDGAGSAAFEAGFDLPEPGALRELDHAARVVTSLLAEIEAEA